MMNADRAAADAYWHGVGESFDLHLAEIAVFE
jgi:hypothetical protein